MEYIKKEELIEGEIYYVSTTYGFWMIGLVTKSNNGDNSYGYFRGNATFINKRLEFNKDQSWCYKGNHRTYRLATPEEKRWLNEAIKLDKFITFEEAMKTFIPEYVELINTDCRINCNIPAGKIYKCSKDVTKDYYFGFFLDSKYKIGFNKNEFDQYLKPSTKEAYDAQFVVKEPEFVLPLRWLVKITDDNLKILNDYRFKMNPKRLYGPLPTKYDYSYMTQDGNGDDGSAYFDKITFEQFKKYVLKEEIVVEEVIEPLPQFKIIESIETITKVENNEGNQFFIGDVVISDSGFVQTIKSFRYNVNKDNVLATTNICNQIGIARLEHYIEPKVEETLLEKAKRLYPVGTKFINPNDNRECVIKEKGNYFEGNNNNIYHSIANTAFKYEEGLSGCIYINNTWSKIIE